MIQSCGNSASNLIFTSLGRFSYFNYLLVCYKRVEPSLRMGGLECSSTTLRYAQVRLDSLMVLHDVDFHKNCL
ncbi:hypothetical protein L1987_65441 [Smallanthus sonchifolius]|uniref:Uncharacterized protein n=1 Tax=Smallanthus sonchifolius TaxID=185202 RepID=A0ACB9BUK7_9ASTR|nr:hypothetical protein L1987_65441 [Smallanthus sonchifolius]